MLETAAPKKIGAAVLFGRKNKEIYEYGEKRTVPYE